MVEGLANQARSAQEAVRRDLETATAKLRPFTADSLAAHQARRDVQRYKLAKTLYDLHQQWCDDEFYPFNQLSLKTREHWLRMADLSLNFTWEGR